MLNDIEKQILNDVFEMQFNHGPILKLNDYDLLEKSNPDHKVKWNEFTSYILKLRSMGYLKFDDNILTTGGRQNQKYRNNVLNVRTEGLEIDKEGIAFVVKERETLKDKVVEGLRNTGRSFFTQLRDGLIGFVVGLIVAWLTGLIS
ncbi:hypothetical protein FZD47_24050 [Bacillus infantis]|uniref:Uncharacterized protein n=1 Tax=Bacillus infantis TaxID=324767 RepID=A0A5D4S815_9BACI|nr:hypothetical protein [Bacillus infantis]TYS57912.1 hypothetical protein FZD47_24050 [Bacillus infantis]